MNVVLGFTPTPTPTPALRTVAGIQTFGVSSALGVPLVLLAVAALALLKARLEKKEKNVNNNNYLQSR